MSPFPRTYSLTLLLTLAACGAGTSSGSSSSGGEDETNTTGGGGAGAGAGGDVTQGGQTPASGGGGSTGNFGTGGSVVNPDVCDVDPDQDFDGDGFSVAQGDCNDCDKNVNPGALEVIGEAPGGTGGAGGAGGDGAGGYAPADEDCDGTADNVPEPFCDDGLALNSSSALDAARAIELCKQAEGPKDWGIVSAKYVRASGAETPMSEAAGLQPTFGPNVLPRGGSRMLALSSGRARTPGQPSECGMSSCTNVGPGTAPAGFPQDVPQCPGATDINDDIGFEVALRAPTNATGYKFAFDFYSFEYPEYVCTMFNDQFIALVNPPPPGSVNGNISFDAQTNPVSVNIAFFEVCEEAACSLGASELEGTGFGEWNDAGATSWLQTTAPVTGGEVVNIRFAIWDTGDTALDSTVLVDNFEWIANGGTVVVGTNPEIPE